MGTEADSGESTLRKVALPGAVAAVAAGIGYLITNKPSLTRLRGLIRQVPEDASDLIDELKERAQSAGGQTSPQPVSQARLDEFDARRRERKKRRDRRKQRATT